MAENISASMVKELRDQTGAGMMDCKAALNESGGNIDAAVDWLRKKGLSKAAKKAGRVAAEGLIGVAVTPTKGIVVEVNSETDFVARNDLFQGLVKMIADAALGAGSDVEQDSRSPRRQHHHCRCNCRYHRQSRREHDAAPRRRAFGRQGRGCKLRAQFGDRRAWPHRRDCRAGIHRQGRRAQGLRPACGDARRLGQSTGGRSVRPRSCRRRAREERARRQVQGAGQARGHDRKDRRVRLEDFLQRGLPARSALHPRRQKERGAGRQRGRRQGRWPDQGRRLRALRAR